MEELTSILGIVVAAGMLLAKLFIREKTRGANGKANPGGEAWPTEQQPAMARPKAEPARTREKSVFEPMAQKVTAHRNNIRKNTPEPKKKPADAARTVGHQPATDAATLRCENREVPAEEFDLRRAIVYAEILKPKFDE